MEDFSEFVGLSRPTVSKYFSDPSSVRPKTRELIEAAIKQSGFRPNLFAVNLNRRRTTILGIIIPNQLDHFYMAMTKRLQSLAEQRGYLAIVLSSDGKPELEKQAIETLRSLNVAGAIIAPLGEESQHSTLARLAEDVPIVYVDSPLDSTSPFVGTDNLKSFHLIVDYLCRSGSEPCYFSMPMVNNNAIKRQDAYRQAMEKLGYEPRIIDLEQSRSWDFERYAFEQTARILRERGRLPTSTVLCSNDRIAFGVTSALWQAGLKIGRLKDCDVRVAGHDNNPLSEYTCPPLTTVAQDYNEIGRLAIELLFRTLGETTDDRLELPETQRILLNAEIKLRMSA
ncbi:MULTISPECIES: LacI family DNA-binding transcriptional regulator [Brucella]|uniref:LacI family DNA-binding transcriptional regulator n=1 Tax=Brucella TaxID=234 RepID=UPI000F672A12|nr:MULTISPECIES: LacI family DNA-binding transcriptional regulator [Brucella]KAB2748356.1 LacI family transcriptional regulator [Brucella anthropi]MDH0367776.1 LacI family transcriptional regulator [Brucella anthropi]RRY11152.1 LacI family transcriptional regulator [Brucella anthropi]RRY18458.1 LacI family transcriptional regulator [Brucella anthropi]UYT55521.1 LacI family transcriptional regulator [Brucella sp. MAB-22]